MARRCLTSGFVNRLINSSNKSAPNRLLSSAALRIQNPSPLTAFAAQSRTFATQGDAEIVKFLTEEISSEKSNQKALPKIAGWESKMDGAEVTLTKAGPGGEQIIVTLNVNHTVDSAEPDDGQGEAPEMLSRPNFEVDVVKTGGKTLSFSCSFIHPEEQSGEADAEEDLFAIEEVTMFEGDKTGDHNYAVAGDILDGYLYDLFMSMLEERGVDNAFAEKMADWCTVHEHSLYIKLLQDIEKFAKM